MNTNDYNFSLYYTSHLTYTVLWPPLYLTKPRLLTRFMQLYFAAYSEVFNTTILRYPMPCHANKRCTFSPRFLTRFFLGDDWILFYLMVVRISLATEQAIQRQLTSLFNLTASIPFQYATLFFSNRQTEIIFSITEVIYVKNWKITSVVNVNNLRLLDKLSLLKSKIISVQM